MATQVEIDKLKKGWAEDPCWDIYDTEGFESHREELRSYQSEMESKWERERLVVLEKRAEEIGVSVETVREIVNLENRVSYFSERAANTLAHQFNDSEADASGVVSDIVDAAVAATTLFILKDGEKK